MTIRYCTHQIYTESDSQWLKYRDLISCSANVYMYSTLYHCTGYCCIPLLLTAHQHFYYYYYNIIPSKQRLKTFKHFIHFQVLSRSWHCQLNSRRSGNHNMQRHPGWHYEVKKEKRYNLQFNNACTRDRRLHDKYTFKLLHQYCHYHAKFHLSHWLTSIGF